MSKLEKKRTAWKAAMEEFYDGYDKQVYPFTVPVHALAEDQIVDLVSKGRFMCFRVERLPDPKKSHEHERTKELRFSLHYLSGVAVKINR